MPRRSRSFHSRRLWPFKEVTVFRYVAFVWHTGNTSAGQHVEILTCRLRSLSDQWCTVFSGPGLCILCADVRKRSAEPYLLEGGRGAVLGTLFERSTSRRATLDANATQAVIESRGQRLIDSYWGRYVAFMIDPRSATKWVLKDPTGNLPCFTTSLHGIDIFFSSVADCERLLPGHFSINWRYVAARVVASWLPVSESPLNSLVELCGGECLEIRGTTRLRSLLWHPLSICRNYAFDNAPEAANALRAGVRDCLEAWATCYSHILHRLSGGLDSSIVLRELRSVSPSSRITCLTYFIPDGYSDERKWARLALGSIDEYCTHIEQPRDAGVNLHDVLRVPPSEHPVSILAYIETGPVERQLTEELQISAIFTGDGGDSLFGRHAKQFAVQDYYSRYGIRSMLFKIASEIALLKGESVWKVLFDSLRNAFFHDDINQERRRLMLSRSLVPSEVIRARCERRLFEHPWFASVNEIPWGIVRQLDLLIVPQYFYDPLCDPGFRDAERVFPLYSQPIVELCLRIPLHLHFLGGQDRGLARLAFSGDVPKEILARQWKDRAPRFFESMLRSNLRFIREILFDGLLVKERLIERERLMEALSESPNRAPVRPGEILDHISVESWLQTWARASSASQALLGTH